MLHLGFVGVDVEEATSAAFVDNRHRTTPVTIEGLASCLPLLGVTLA